MDESTAKHIVSAGEKQGLLIQEDSIKPLESTGFMSKVFTAETDRGKAIIHIIQNPVPEQKYQHIPEKIYFMGELLKDVPQIPEVYITGALPHDGYFLVQEHKNGKPLGKRSYENNKFTDEFLVENEGKYLSELQDIVLGLHGHILNKFGYIDFSSKMPAGTHETWLAFLIDNFKRNIDLLQSAEKSDDIRYFEKTSFEEVEKRVAKLFEEEKQHFATDKPRLIHGDVFNYSNVLISDKGIEGVIDLEWALSGHPAWEFVFSKDPPLDEYIKNAIEKGIIENEKDFRRSVELHTILWCAWGASVHARNPEFGPALYKIFLEKLIENT